MTTPKVPRIPAALVLSAVVSVAMLSIHPSSESGSLPRHSLARAVSGLLSFVASLLAYPNSPAIFPLPNWSVPCNGYWTNWGEIGRAHV